MPASLAEQVMARDGTSPGPGCEIPAEHCDLDHPEEWEPDGAGGPTAETNLAALHRGHHNLKTGGFWDSDQSPDGTLRWRTATGRTVTTYPYVYDHPDNLAVRQTSSLEARPPPAGVRAPGIPIPGRLNILDQIDWAQALAPATPKPRNTPGPPHDTTSTSSWRQPLFRHSTLGHHRSDARDRPLMSRAVRAPTSG